MTFSTCVTLKTYRFGMALGMASCIALTLAALWCAGTVAADPVAFKDCGHGNVKSVNILSCKKLPCKVKIGTRITFEAALVAPFDVSSAFNDIGAYIERHRFRLPEPRVDACNGYLSPHCPMRKGQTYIYRYTMPVREIYPATPAIIEYKLTNEDGRLIGCTSIPVQIVR